MPHINDEESMSTTSFALYELRAHWARQDYQLLANKFCINRTIAQNDATRIPKEHLWGNCHGRRIINADEILISYDVTRNEGMYLNFSRPIIFKSVRLRYRWWNLPNSCIGSDAVCRLMFCAAIDDISM